MGHRVGHKVGHRVGHGPGHGVAQVLYTPYKMHGLISSKMAECFGVGLERKLCVITLTTVMGLPDPRF